MASNNIKSDNENLSTLLQLEAEARRAESEKALQFLMVNETRRLINYRQAFLFSTMGGDSQRVEAASSLSLIDRNTPFITWLEATVKKLHEADQTTQRVSAGTFEPAQAGQFEEFSMPHVISCPLLLPDGQKIGGVWLARETPWEDHEVVLVERLSETYAHAWAALVGRKSFQRPTLKSAVKSKWVISAIIGCLLLVSLFPVRLSTVAPVEIVPLNPVIVSAPMDGVIKIVTQSPNTSVKKGDVVFIYEDTSHRNAYQIAVKSFDVATARLRKATQGAFGDESFKGQVALLTAELSLKETELEYARELLQQVEVTATIDGLLVYSDKSDWTGKPVAIGEKIMEIVDPRHVQLRILVPVDDAIVLVDDAEVDVFLHAQPLTSIKAQVTGASFNAYLTPAKVLAYRVDAKIIDSHDQVRIGLQGSAKIYGERVSLFFYVFRRPISSLRQFLGL